MKTISDCFLFIAAMCPLGLADLYFAINGISEGNWIVVALNAIAFVMLVFAIRSVYRTSKDYEKILCDAISDLQVKSAIRDLADFFESRKPDQKDKSDEVATDK